ncbi:hypothetical protein LCGC14_2249940, partial [marine sediment metagenome]
MLDNTAKQALLNEIKVSITSAFYDFPHWCHTPFQAECERLGDLIKKFIEQDKDSYLLSTDEIGRVLVEAVFECKDIV